MALGELQVSSYAVSRCAIRSFLVFFLYWVRAVSKMDWKWEEGLEVDGGLRGLVGGVSGFLEGEARFKSKTAGSMASSEQ